MFSILEPGAAVYFLTLLPLAIIFFWAQRERIKRLTDLGKAYLAPVTVQQVKIAVKLGVIALLIVSALRPYTGYKEIEVGRAGRDNLLLIDISKSMLAKDLSPSRLAVVKRKISDLLSILTAKHLGDRVGIILFAGQAYLYCPLTQDFGTAKEFIKSISPELITAQGSGINLALKSAVGVIERAKINDARVFLFTDGEDHGFDSDEALSTLKTNSIRPLILGFGTVKGTPIEIAPGQYLKDNGGNIVISKLNEERLSLIAHQSGGLYHRATLNDSDLNTLLSFGQTGDLFNAAQGKSQIIRVYNEQGSWIVFAILMFITILFLLGKRSWIFAILFLLYAEPSYGAPSLYEGYKLYNKGDYEGARAIFEKHWEEDPNDREVNQALGSAYYKLGDYKKAQHLFKESERLSSTGKDKFEAQYNLGNSLLMDKQYEEAIRNYESALKVKAGDEKTEHNLELAKSLLKKEENSENKEKNDGKGGDENSEENKDKERSSDSDERADKSDSQEENPERSDSNNGSESQEKDDRSPEDGSSDKENSENPEDKGAKNDLGAGEDEDPSTQDQAGQQIESTEEEIKGEVKSLDQLEAEQWLKSLPDAPILLQKKNEPIRSRIGQTW